MPHPARMPANKKMFEPHPEYNASLSAGVASKASSDAIVVRVNIPR